MEMVLDNPFKNKRKGASAQFKTFTDSGGGGGGIRTGIYWLVDLIQQLHIMPFKIDIVFYLLDPQDELHRKALELIVTYV